MPFATTYPGNLRAALLSGMLGAPGAVGALRALPLDPEHEAEMARSRDYAAALNAASPDGMPVRGAAMGELADRFPERAYPVGTVTIGGNDLGHPTTRAVPRGTLGALSARIAGLAPPTGYEPPPAARPDFVPRGDGRKFGEIESRRVANLKKAVAGADILARMQAGENVSPGERRTAYRHLAATQRAQKVQADRDATLVAAVAGFDSGRTQRMFRQAVMSGDMQSARALLAARQQEIEQEGAAGEVSNRARMLDLQSQALSDRFELGRMENERLREASQGELGLGRERLGLGRDEIAARERMAQFEQRSTTARLIAAANQQMLRDANQFGYARALAGDQAQAQLALRAAEREAARESAATERRENRFNAIAPHILAARDYELPDILPRLDALLAGDTARLSEIVKAGPKQPNLIEKRVRPELLERWDALSGGDAERVPLRDFILSVPSDQRKSAAFKEYVENRYMGEDVRRSLRMGPFDYSIFDKRRNAFNERRIREALQDLFPDEKFVQVTGI